MNEEVYGFRDSRISARHRQWGVGCPAIDLDFIMMEFNFDTPCALVEYKHHNIGEPDIDTHSFRALAKLASANEIPAIIALYWPDIWAFKVYPLNSYARRHFDHGQYLSEKDFVRWLYKSRNKSYSDELQFLNEQYPGT